MAVMSCKDATCSISGLMLISLSWPGFTSGRLSCIYGPNIQESMFGTFVFLIIPKQGMSCPSRTLGLLEAALADKTSHGPTHSIFLLKEYG